MQNSKTIVYKQNVFIKILTYLDSFKEKILLFKMHICEITCRSPVILCRGVVFSRAATLLQSIETKRFNWEICPPGVTITQGGAFFVVKNLRSPKKFQKISENPKKFRKKVVLILKKKLWSEQRL